jgi:hypothetical protein
MRSRHARPDADTQEITADVQDEVPIDALTLAQGKPTRGVIRRIALDHLSLPSDSRRNINPESIHALADRIESGGPLQSLLVVPGENSQYCVVAGERRFAAFRLLAKQGRISPTFLVSCRVISGRGTAEADSTREIGPAEDRLEAAERRRRFIDLLNQCPGLLTGSELAIRRCHT